MNTFPISLLVAAALFGGSIAAPATAIAASSDWAENEGGRMRLVVTATDQPGQYEGVLQIEPKPGWITYWREPGDSGIPPEIKFDPDSGLNVTSMAFPAPKRIDNGPVRDLGYDSAVSFPLKLETPEGAAGQEVSAHAFIGICQNICIPFQADFEVTLPAVAEPLDAILVAQARAMLPEKPSTGFKVENVTRSQDGEGLLVDIVMPSGKTPTVYVTGPPGTVYMDSHMKARQDGRLTLFLPIADLPAKGDPEGKVWRLLAIAGDRAMESPLAFK